MNLFPSISALHITFECHCLPLASLVSFLLLCYNRYKALGGVDQPMTFDWYQDYKTLKPYLQPFLQDNKDLSILIPGCGNSRRYIRFRKRIYKALQPSLGSDFAFSCIIGMGPDLYKDGYKDITSIDISPLVVERMTDLFQDLEDLECKARASFVLFVLCLSDLFLSPRCSSIIRSTNGCKRHEAFT